MAPLQKSKPKREAVENDVQGQDVDSEREILKNESLDGGGLSSEDEEDLESDEGNESSGSDEEVQQQIQNVSFGALKQAQDSLARKRKRGSDTTAEQEDKLEALRARLNEIRSKSKIPKNEKTSQDRGHERRSVQDRADEAGFASDSDSDSAPSEEENVKSRTSKHAPASQSSRRPVTRKREVVDVPNRKLRDPRFDTLQQVSTHGGNSGKAYSFLRDYEKDEIAELKSAIKQSRDEDDKETLRRKMNSMQNRIKSQEAKEREQEIQRQHRREEKEKVEQGKKPFFLKRKDVKERAIVEKFKGMKSKDREKLIEKRRRKEDQKEKRRMPDARRFNG